MLLLSNRPYLARHACVLTDAYGSFGGGARGGPGGYNDRPRPGGPPFGGRDMDPRGPPPPSAPVEGHERPKLNLLPRQASTDGPAPTAAVVPSTAVGAGAEGAVPAAAGAAAAPAPAPAKPKSNPFGNARPVDTAAKIRELEEKAAQRRAEEAARAEEEKRLAEEEKRRAEEEKKRVEEERRREREAAAAAAAAEAEREREQARLAAEERQRQAVVEQQRVKEAAEVAARANEFERQVTGEGRAWGATRGRGACCKSW